MSHKIFVDIIEGCTDNAANNFNEIANLDDGSCDYNIIACDIIPSGLNVNNIIHNRVTFNWIAASINPSHYDKISANWYFKLDRITAGFNYNEYSGTSRTRYFMEPGTTYEWSMRASIERRWFYELSVVLVC